MGRPPSTAVIGAGMTGLAVASVSGLPVFEQSDGPGGICRSYYLRPGDAERLDHAPAGDGAYRFEVGGGHWIFGGDPATLARLEDLVEFRVYQRTSEPCSRCKTPIERIVLAGRSTHFCPRCQVAKL